MGTLTEFLLARIAEDEAAARAAGDGEWEAGERCVWRVSPIQTIEVVDDGRDGWGGCGSPEIAAHIALHDPARVLAECEAKRGIVDALTYVDLIRGEACHLLHDPDTGGKILRLLALPYADHPDYRDVWRP